MNYLKDKKVYTQPSADVELFTINNIISTSPGQDSGENPPIIINNANGSIDVYVEDPDEFDGVDY